MHPVIYSAVTKEECAQILQKFLEDIAFEMPARDYNLAVGDQVKKHFENAGFSEDFIHDLQPIIQASAGIAMTTYHDTPTDIQCFVGIFTTYAIAIDDRVQELNHDLKDFSTRLLFQQPQGNDLLQSFTDFLRPLCRIFGQFGGDMIIKDSLQFVSACYLEAEAEKRLRFPADAPDFADYLRLKTGVAEAYSFMMFPEQEFPEDEYLDTYLPAIWYMQLYLDYTNDIMSFYKEALQKDDFNFVNNFAKSSGLTPIESLRKVCNKTAEIVQRLRIMSTPDSKMSKVIEGFIQGYVVYHLCQPRYQLEELDIPMLSQAQCQANTLVGAEKPLEPYA